MRNQFDYYPTPIEAIEALLDREEFLGQVLEPACGDGRIVEACQRRKLNCIGTDIQQGQDFFELKNRPDCIITNPPYSEAEEFVLHALRLARKKVAMLLRLNFLGGIERYEKIWRRFPLKTMYVFSKRLNFGEDFLPTESHAWFIWERNHVGAPTIQHIFNLTAEEKRQRAAKFVRSLTR